MLIPEILAKNILGQSLPILGKRNPIYVPTFVAPAPRCFAGSILRVPVFASLAARFF